MYGVNLQNDEDAESLSGTENPCGPFTDNSERDTEIGDTETESVEKARAQEDESEVEMKELEFYYLKTRRYKLGVNSKSVENSPRKLTYICKICEKEVNTKSNITEHVRSHLGVKLFKCKLCGKALSRKQNAVHHLKFIHYIDSSRVNEMILRNDQLDILDKSSCNSEVKSEKVAFSECSSPLDFKESQNMRLDSLSVTKRIKKEEPDKDKTEECNKIKEISPNSDNESGGCNRKKLKPNLKNTGVENENIKQDCNFINQDIKTERDLSEDALKYEDVEVDNVLIEKLKDENNGATINKKYRCKICGFTSDRRYYLIHQHMMKHTGAKRFICVICNKTYTRKYVIRRHLVKEHNIAGDEVEIIIDASEVDKKRNDSGNHSMLFEEAAKDNFAEVPSNEDNETTKGIKRKYEEVENEETEKDNVMKANPEDEINDLMNIEGNSGDVCESPDKRTKSDIPPQSQEFSFSAIQGDTPTGFTYRCNLCGFVCPRKYYMENMHRLKHTGGKPYLCVICCKTYCRKYVLRSHLLKEHKLSGDELENIMATTGVRIDHKPSLNADMNASYGCDIDAFETPDHRNSSPTQGLMILTKDGVEVNNDNVELEEDGMNEMDDLERKAMEDELSNHMNIDDSYGDDIDESMENNDGESFANSNDTINKSMDGTFDNSNGNDDSLIESMDQSLDHDIGSSDKLLTINEKLQDNVNKKGLVRLRAKKTVHPYNDVIESLMDLKTLTCLKCNKQCSKKSNLKQHIRILHFNLKQYSCQICGRPFNTNYNLKVHMRQHLKQEEKEQSNIPCTVCGKFFTTKSYIRVHMLKYHSGKQEKKAKNKDGDSVNDP